MRSLRSRTVGNTPSTSEASVTKSLTKVSKKKSKSRRTQISPSKDCTESSENDNVFVSPKNLNEKETKIGRKMRKTKRHSFDTISIKESNNPSFNKTVGSTEVEDSETTSKIKDSKKNKLSTAFESIIKKTQNEHEIGMETALNECMRETRKSKVVKNKTSDDDLVKSLKKKRFSTTMKRGTFVLNHKSSNELERVENTTFDANDDNQLSKSQNSSVVNEINSTFDSNDKSVKNRKSNSIKNTTFDNNSQKSKSTSNINTTFDSNNIDESLQANGDKNLTFDKDDELGKRKSNKSNATFVSNEGLKNLRSKSVTNISSNDIKPESRKSIRSNITFASNEKLKRNRNSNSANNLTNVKTKLEKTYENQKTPNKTFDSEEELNQNRLTKNVKNSSFESNNDKKLSARKSYKNIIRLSQKEFVLPSDDSNSVDLDNEVMPEFYKLDTSSSSREENKTVTANQSCIVIDDSIEDSNKLENVINLTLEKNATFDKSTTKNDTFNKNQSRRETFDLSNGSGNWSVKDVAKESLNDSNLHKKHKSKSQDHLNDPDVVLHQKRKSSDSNLNDSDHITLHKKPKTKSSDRIFDFDTDHITLHKNLLNETFDTPNKSLRKKWVKFQTEPNNESPILRKSSFYNSKSSKSLFSSTPFDKKYPLTPAKLNKSAIKNTSIVENKSTTKSVKKSALKPKAMPNFALIHQKANEKIESLKDYSERKHQRAEKLLSGEKPENSKENHKTNAVKSSEELFGNIQVKTPKSTKKPVKIIKPKVFVSKLPQLATRSVLTTIQDVNKSKTESAKSKLDKSNLDKSKTEKPKVKPVVIVKPTEKPIFLKKPVIPEVPKKEVSVFSKGHLKAIANKTKTKEGLANRDNRRDQLKGVRTNRRFDLLMQMRNK